MGLSMKKFFAAPLFAIAVAGGAVGAQAATQLTFDAVPSGDVSCPPEPASFVESGYTISNCPVAYIYPGDIHLDDGGTPINSFVDISRVALFDALSIEVRGYGTEVYEPGVPGPYDYDNVVVTGFRSGSEVANQSFSTTTLASGSITSFLLSSEFSGLDSLRVRQVFPSPALYPWAVCEDFPCAHIDLVSAVVQDFEVPLPGALPLLAGGIGVLAAFAGMARQRRVF